MGKTRYPETLPIFSIPGEGLYIATGPTVAGPFILFAGHLPCALDSVVPLTISAVLMYEACGGTLESSISALAGRPGRRPHALFARAHAYAAARAELGIGC